MNGLVVYMTDDQMTDDSFSDDVDHLTLVQVLMFKTGLPHSNFRVLRLIEFYTLDQIGCISCNLVQWAFFRPSSAEPLTIIASDWSSGMCVRGGWWKMWKDENFHVIYSVQQAWDLFCARFTSNPGRFFFKIGHKLPDIGDCNFVATVNQNYWMCCQFCCGSSHRVTQISRISQIASTKLSCDDFQRVAEANANCIRSGMEGTEREVQIMLLWKSVSSCYRQNYLFAKWAHARKHALHMLDDCSENFPDNMF